MSVRKRKERRPIPAGLQLVAEFLNEIGRATGEAQWTRFLKIQRSKGHGFPSVTFDDAKMLRRKLEHDLAFLKADQPEDRPFDSLIYQLNELKLRTVWQCHPLSAKARPTDPSQAVMTIKLMDGTARRWIAQSWPVTRTLQDHFYAILGKAMESGTIGRLRVCRHCGAYLVVSDTRQQVCPGCKDTYQNRKREPGYSTRRKRDRRERKLAEARKRLQRGASWRQVARATGLPERVVEREWENLHQ